MPRPRRTRTIGAEDALASRVRTELGRRHWSYAMLAQMMRQAGVDISPSSLQKSFTSGKAPAERRPIRVDELVALAHVFKTTVENLLSPRDWVDHDQVDKALTDLDRADRLLGEAVQTMLDAQIMLVQAAAHAPADMIQDAVGRNTTYWQNIPAAPRLTPRAATPDSPTISTQAIQHRLAQLKTLIHTIATDWTTLNDLHLPEWQLRHRDLIGTTTWDTARSGNDPLSLQPCRSLIARKSHKKQKIPSQTLPD
ncbi:MAG: hypothetical protein LBI33_10160 [Propionibacteriaceae bacterium]|nr:hypothetical protein [Propionibacteriaceae bacterium]